VTALSDLLAEHRPWSSHRCRCGWEGDRFNVHLHDMLVVPASRKALVSGLLDAGILVPAGMWAVPDPVAELARVADRVKTAKTDAELDALLDYEGDLRALLASGRNNPYYEDEPRPAYAPELYVIGDGRG
jgi:hypothetical protein